MPVARYWNGSAWADVAGTTVYEQAAEPSPDPGVGAIWIDTDAPDPGYRTPVAAMTRVAAFNHTSLGNYQKIPLDTAAAPLEAGSGIPDGQSQIDLVNGRLVCRRAGLYWINAACSYATNATGARGAAFQVNGVYQSIGQVAASAGFETRVGGVARVCALVEGDYADLWGMQNAAASLAYHVTGSAGVGVRLEWKWLCP